MSDELYKCVIVPNTRTYTLRSTEWEVSMYGRIGKRAARKRAYALRNLHLPGLSHRRRAYWAAVYVKHHMVVMSEYNKRHTILTPQ